MGDGGRGDALGSGPLRVLCAIWPAAGGDEIWVTRFIAVPRVGEILTFAEGRRYRVVRVEHEADLPEAALDSTWRCSWSPHSPWNQK